MMFQTMMWYKLWFKLNSGIFQGNKIGSRIMVSNDCYLFEYPWSWWESEEEKNKRFGPGTSCGFLGNSRNKIRDHHRQNLL
jgi:hypothetical protein